MAAPQIMFARSTMGFYNTGLNTNIPSDTVIVTQEAYDALMAAQCAGDTIGVDAQGNPVAVPFVPTQAQTAAAYAAALQGKLDAQARAWGYDSLLSAASYASSTVAQFAAESHALTGWRDTAWSNAAALQAAVQAGTQPMPATVAAFLAIVLPAAPARPTA